MLFFVAAPGASVNFADFCGGAQMMGYDEITLANLRAKAYVYSNSNFRTDFPLISNFFLTFSNSSKAIFSKINKTLFEISGKLRIQEILIFSANLLKFRNMLINIHVGQQLQTHEVN